MGALSQVCLERHQFILLAKTVIYGMKLGFQINGGLINKKTGGRVEKVFTISRIRNEQL